MLEKNPREHLLQIEKQLRLADQHRVMSIETTFLALQAVLEQHRTLLLREHAITEMIGRRMFYHYHNQKLLKQLLDISIAAPGYDVFEQAVAIYLAAFLRPFGDFKVALNHQFFVKGGIRLRPDIAVTHAERKIAALEVKTDLGWNREYIKNGEWAGRRKAFIEVGFPQSYLVILTKINWYKQGWVSDLCKPDVLDKLGVTVLFHEHPNDPNKFPWYRDEEAQLHVEGDPLHPADIIHFIEPLFEEISRHNLTTQ